MRPIDADALIEVVEKSMAENPHKEKTQRAMHIHEHKYFLTLLAGIPTIQPEVLACGNGELIAKLEPQWIPVSERLPEEDGKYMVTIHGYGWNGKTFTSVSVAECIGKRWVGNNGVIAWMPLPEAYKPNK